MKTVNRVFLDTAYIIALVNKKDHYHEKAHQLAEKLKAAKTRFITTDAILLEIGNALAKVKYRRAAVELIESLIDDPAVEITPLSPELLSKAITFYKRYLDKEWGLTDCVSFAVMEEQGLTQALTTDVHFKQAGFKPLLIED
ncbi:MAG: PIN domain-containing protein [Bacillota bacterium]